MHRCYAQQILLDLSCKSEVIALTPHQTFNFLEYPAGLPLPIRNCVIERASLADNLKGSRSTLFAFSLFNFYFQFSYSIV